MSFDWSDYLTLAKQLAEQCGTGDCFDAKLRSSVSRAYFAAYCLAKKYLTVRENMKVPRGYKGHAFVETSFRLIDKTVAANLHRLRLSRNAADYDDVVPELEKVCEKCVGQAELTVNKIRLRLGV